MARSVIGSARTVAGTRSTATRARIDFGTALQFPGSTGNGISCGITNLPNIGSAVTMAAWFNKGALTGARDLMSLIGSSINTNIRFNGTTDLRVTKSAGGNLVNTPRWVGAGVWHHIAFTFDGTTNILYLDGQWVAQSTTAHNSGTTTAAWICRDNAGAYWDGIVDEPSIWNRALTSAELLSLVKQRIVPASGLVLRYLLDEGTGTSVSDSSGNGNTGTVSLATGFVTSTVLGSRSVA